CLSSFHGIDAVLLANWRSARCFGNARAARKPVCAGVVASQGVGRRCECSAVRCDMRFSFGDFWTNTGRRAAPVIQLSCAAVLALASSACSSTRGGTIPYDVADFGAPDTQTTQVLDENYQIAPLDTLKVNVFQVEDLSGDYEVDLTGHIAMPLIGSVRAVDM